MGAGPGGDNVVLRTARASDTAALCELARLGGPGFTNLPAEKGALGRKLEASERALEDEGAREAGAAILFVVEQAGELVGTSCVFPRVGAEWPFYSYRLTRQAAQSVAAGRRKAQTVLNLANDFDGEAEVGGLLVRPDRRGRALGELAARARYLFIAAHRGWFGRRVIAELRGWQDSGGRSPVWDAIGRHFYGMEFAEADRFGALSGNQFIADLGPRHPLYVSLLPRPAQEALGRPHDDGRSAYEMLLREGFRAGDYVNIFDGGPTLVADIDAVRTIREAVPVTLERVAEGGSPAVASAGRGRAFRVAMGHADPVAGLVSPTLAERLRIAGGEPLLVAPA